MTAIWKKGIGQIMTAGRISLWTHLVSVTILGLSKLEPLCDTLVFEMNHSGNQECGDRPQGRSLIKIVAVVKKESANCGNLLEYHAGPSWVSVTIWVFAAMWNRCVPFLYQLHYPGDPGMRRPTPRAEHSIKITIVV